MRDLIDTAIALLLSGSLGPSPAHEGEGQDGAQQEEGLSAVGAHLN